MVLDLKLIPTAKLVEELKCREGVNVAEAGPYEDWKVEIGWDDGYYGDGPIIILMVTD